MKVHCYILNFIQQNEEEGEEKKEENEEEDEEEELAALRKAALKSTRPEVSVVSVTTCKCCLHDYVIEVII